MIVSRETSRRFRSAGCFVVKNLTRCHPMVHTGHMTTTQETDTFPLGLTISIYVPEDASYDDDGRATQVFPEYVYVGTAIKVEPIGIAGEPDQMITVELPDGETAYAFDGEWTVVDPFADVPSADVPTDQIEEDTQPYGLDYDEPMCEHGLTAIYCGGPMHWYDETNS